MSEGQTLLLILCLLYLSECIVWVGRRTVLFSSPWGRRWRTSFGSEYLGNPDGGLALLHPLPPLGSAFLGHWSPMSISPIGVCDLNLQGIGRTVGPCQAGRVLSYDEISEVAIYGKYVVLNGSRFAKCATVDQAESLAQLIDRVSRESPESREKMIRESITAQFNKDEALGRLAQVKGLIPRLRWISSALFLFLYVLAPMMAVAFGLSLCIIPTAIVMLSTAVFIAIRFVPAHRVIYPLRKGDRVSSVVKMISCPPVAIRAGDFLTLEAMSRFHPLLLSNLLLGPDESAFPRAVVRDLTYPLRDQLADPRAVAVGLWYANAQLDACADFLKTAGAKTMNDLLSPPAWDGASVAYCPRCLCQFTIQSGECPDCPGIGLLPLPRTETSEAIHE